MELGEKMKTKLSGIRDRALGQDLCPSTHTLNHAWSCVDCVKHTNPQALQNVLFILFHFFFEVCHMDLVPWGPGLPQDSF